MQEETIQNNNLQDITQPQIKNSQIYLFTTLSYFIQGMFNIMTIYYLTNYYDKYLGFSRRDIFLITLIAYFPLILKPFFGFYFSRKNINNSQIKFLLIISSFVFFCSLCLMSLISTSNHIFFFIGLFFCAQLSVAIFDTLNDTLIISLGKNGNFALSSLQQLGSIIGGFLILFFYGIFISEDISNGNWPLLFILWGFISSIFFVTLIFTKFNQYAPLLENNLKIGIEKEENSEVIDKKKKISKNLLFFLLFIFLMNIPYLVDIQSEQIYTARFGESSILQIGSAISYSQILQIVVLGVIVFYREKILLYRKTILFYAGIFSFIFLLSNPFISLKMIIIFNILNGPVSILMIICLVSMMISFSPIINKGTWYQIFAVVYVLGRYLFTFLGTGLSLLFDLDHTDPTLFILSALGLLIINLPLLYLIKIPKDSK